MLKDYVCGLGEQVEVEKSKVNSAKESHQGIVEVQSKQRNVTVHNRIYYIILKTDEVILIMKHCYLKGLRADCESSLENVTSSKCAVRELVDSFCEELSRESGQCQDHVTQWSNQLQAELGNRVGDVHAFLQEKMKKDFPTGD